MRADDLEPGPPTFARLSYQAELRGDLAEATRLMRLSRDAATADAPAYAFASFHLGELARAAGDLPAAGRHYAAALSADPTYAPALAGRARLAAARGDYATAVRTYRSVVARLPLPEYVAELADLYLATGRPDQAEQQLAVAAASARLAAANGVRTDLETALVEADHGSPADALRAARAEWRSAAPSTPPTRWRGRCTRPAATGRPWPTPGGRPRSARRTPGCSSTAAPSRPRSGCAGRPGSTCAPRCGSTPASARCASSRPAQLLEGLS